MEGRGRGHWVRGDKDAIMGEGMQMRRVLRGTGQIGGVGPTV
jgi:hypothetical protein